MFSKFLPQTSTFKKIINQQTCALTIHKPELLTLFKVMTLIECPNFWWHHIIIIFLDIKILWHQYWILTIIVDVRFSQSLLYPYSIEAADLATEFKIFFIFIFNSFSFSLKYLDCNIFTIHFSASCNSLAFSKLRLLLEKYNTLFDFVGAIPIFCSVLIFHFSSSATIRFIFSQHIFLHCFLRGNLQHESCLFLLVFSILDLLIAIILEKELCTLKPSISISKMFQIDTSGSIIWRILLLIGHTSTVQHCYFLESCKLLYH